MSPVFLANAGEALISGDRVGTGKGIPVKTSVLCIVLLLSALAEAETVIIEYPDHFYVESVGIPGERADLSRDNETSPAKATTLANHENSNTSPASARPVTNFDNSQHPVDAAERRVSMEKELQRLQRERSELLTPQEGETSDRANRRQQEAQGKLRKINKMQSELPKMP